MFFSLRDEDTPISVNALAHPWHNMLLYAFPPLCLITPTGLGERTEPQSNIDNTQVAQSTMAGRDHSSSVCLGPSHYTQTSCPKQMGKSTTLTQTEWPSGLKHTGAPHHVIATIQNARASSTQSLYVCKWCVFEECCKGCQLVSYQWSLSDILWFLQDLMDSRKSFYHLP